MVNKAADIWREYNTAGNPLTLQRNPPKAEIREWGTWIEDNFNSRGVSIANYGGVAGNIAIDNAAAVEAAAAALGSEGGSIFIPAGRWYFSTNIDLPAGVPILLIGLGSSASELVSLSGARLIYTGGTPTEWDTPQLYIEWLGIKTLGAFLHNLVDVSFTGGTGSTAVTFGCRDVEIGSLDGNATFNCALKLHNVRNFKSDNLRILGDRTGAITSAFGIEVTGDSDPVEMTFEKVAIFYVNTACYVHGDIEGVHWSHCQVVATNVGLKYESAAAGTVEGWLAVHDSHFNCEQRNIIVNRVSEVTIHDNDLYASNSGFGATEHKSIYIIYDTTALARLNCKIHHNNFQGINPITRTAIEFAGGVGNDVALVDGNSFVSWTNGIVCAATVTGVVVADDNTFNTTTTPWTDNGSGNIFCPRIQTGTVFHKGEPDGTIRKWGKSTVTLNAAGAGSINLATVGNAFPAALDAAFLQNASTTVPATAIDIRFNDGASSSSALNFLVLPNPGVISMTIDWQAIGR